MEWIECLKKGITYIENNLLEDLTLESIGKEVNMSSYYFQKGFSIVSDVSVSEYIRNRRLYLAGLEVCENKQKIIDIAYKYRYDTPESFSKAFYRFHNIYPSAVKGDIKKIKVFLPLKIKITIQGGNEMDFTIEKMGSFKIIGFEREFTMEEAYKEIPKFWDEIFIKFMKNVCSGKEAITDVEKAICLNNIGEYAICMDGIKSFKYYICGKYKGKEIPKELKVVEIPEQTWAKFECVGKLPFALQSVNEKIYKEWLPGNSEYELVQGPSVEWYAEGDSQKADYKSAIWIPVKAK